MNRTISLFAMGVTATLLAACGHPEATTPAAASTDSATAAARAIATAHSTATARAARSPPPDACALVSEGDAEGILGTPVKPGERGAEDKYTSHCQYEALDQSHGFNNLVVEIAVNEDVDEAKTGLSIKRQLYHNDGAGSIYVYKGLSGIGDDAFVVVNKTQEPSPELAGMYPHQQMLFVIKGASDVQLTTSYMAKTRGTDSLEALAAKIAAHI